jgi:nitric oxide reductase NorQ protein
MAARRNSNNTVRFGRVELARFDQPQAPDFLPAAEEYIDPHGYAEQLAFAWSKGWDVALLGPTGVGKTALVRHMCRELNRAYRRFPCEEATDTAALIGKPWLVVDEKGKQSMQFMRGIAYDALLYDHTLVLDEWNLAHPDVQMALNPLFRVDEGQLIVVQNEGEIVERGEHFRLVATGNPGTYAGVKAWNPAALSRFDLVIWMEYLPFENEKHLLVSQSGIQDAIAAAMVKAAGLCREAVADNTLRFPFSYRELRNWADAAPTFGIAEGAEIAVVGKAEKDDQESVRELLKSSFPSGTWS